MSDDFDKVAEFYNETYYGHLNNPEGGPSRHYRNLAKKLAIKPGQKVLDIACGTGNWLLAVRQRGASIAGMDISDRAISMCREILPEGEFFCGAAESLPFPDSEFNVVTCLGSLEHFLDQEGALKEMVRVAKPDARILILVPNSGFLTYRLGLFSGTQQQAIKETIRSTREWEKLFFQAGLSVDARWRDLHVLSVSWIMRRPYWTVPVRALQAISLAVWPISWQYQIYYLCSVKNNHL